MGGGLMQLVAYGAQDIYLTGNPQITFFKVVYRRHTNFSMESIHCTFNGNADFGKKVNVTIPRNGDLVGAMYLEIELPSLGDAAMSYSEGIGNALIKSVEVEIGGQKIDKHYGEWLDIWGELNVDANHKTAYRTMVGNSGTEGAASLVGASKPVRFYVPLRFWFNRNPGLALPLIALQYHEVKLNFEFEPASKLVTADGKVAVAPTAITSCKLYTDYIYLDTDERRRFAQVSHEYLIEQVQHTGVESLSDGTSSASINLDFNHPVKSMHWVIQHEDFLSGSNADTRQKDKDGTDTTTRNVKGNQKLVYYVRTPNTDTHGANDTFNTAKLMLNGHDRAPERKSDYYRLVQNYEHMAACPDKTIYTYSFALKASEHQPSGTCNFSRIDNATLRLTFTNGTNQQASGARQLRIFAVNYNVLRIMSGMGGLAYSN